MQSNNSTVTSVNDSASSQTLVSANPLRRELIIQNDSSSTLYVKFGGSAATSTDYTVKLYTDDIVTTGFQGNVYGIWSADSSGAARVTELA